MYAFIEGKLVEKTPTYAVINANGVGYFINISLNTFSQIKNLDTCKLLTYLIVREDAMLLFGFAGDDERKLFSELISVSGVGANTARIILSSLTLSELINAITTDNASVLQSVKGIGAKTAQRIIIDLKDKLAKEVFSFDNLTILHNTSKDEALSGLLMLGFNKRLAEKALDKIISSSDINQVGEGSSLSVESLIKEALKVL